MPTNVLIIQTAFIGDVVLVTPLIQAAKDLLAADLVSVLVRPSTAELLYNNPSVDEIIPYDKNQKQKGLSDLMAMSGRLSGGDFDVAFIPHRSFRSALLAWLARIPQRVGFSSSGGRWLLTRTVPYESVHEVDRNLSLLPRETPIEAGAYPPALYPDDGDRAFVDALLHRQDVEPAGTLIGVNPGSTWATKRWQPEGFAEIVRRSEQELGARVILFGGWEDTELCQRIALLSGGTPLIAAGEAKLLQSAALVARCSALVSNDSAMAHIGAAMGTPVIDIFGPTVTEFGFTPYGEGHCSVQRDLSCRPCGSHGGVSCPIGTHECMTSIGADEVFSVLKERLSSPS
ncbi:MAG: glycosyltransferase family 9 protein [Candidatus Latescibacteria bacterium]|jgi:heptosyltransferase II|nr:glycosyltransferase family 9 protein [Candidatus Latescibacterota bacterium]